MDRQCIDDPYAADDAWTSANETKVSAQRPATTLLLFADRHAPAKHEQGLEAVRSAWDGRRVGPRQNAEATYFEQCLHEAVYRVAVVDSLLSGSLAYVGLRIVRLRGAQQPFRLIVPLALAALPWTNLVVPSNRVRVCEKCYLSFMSGPTSEAARIRHAYAKVYPNSPVILGARAMAEEVHPGQVGSYEAWLSRAEPLLALVPRYPPSEGEGERHYSGVVWGERPNAGPFGMPLGSPASTMSLPMAHHAEPQHGLDRDANFERQVALHPPWLAEHAHPSGNGSKEGDEHMRGFEAEMEEEQTEEEEERRGADTIEPTFPSHRAR